ncbi:MAG TPA: aquaporin [Candidatus Acidoferrales bacterium]|jgi:MIP family channel proteins|nr:aquaporin [Candidatus Acidoferrales bacterium]
MLYRLPQKLVAEFIGTFAVVFIAAGAICADQYLHAAGAPGIGPLGAALAYGLAVGAMVSAFGHISGGHLNPAITIGCWVTKRLGTIQSLCYVTAQLLGAVAGGYTLSAILPESTWRPVSLGAPDLASDFTRMHGMALEAALTFAVVVVAFATVIDARGSFRQAAGLPIGLAVAIGYLVGAPFTGAAMNPARAFGPALALTPHHWQNHGVYWVGPLFGGVLAGVIYDRVFLRDQPSA